MQFGILELKLATLTYLAELELNQLSVQRFKLVARKMKNYFLFILLNIVCYNIFRLGIILIAKDLNVKLSEYSVITISSFVGLITAYIIHKVFKEFVVKS